MFFYILYRIGFFLSNALPLKVVYWLAERFADIHYCISKKDREAVTENLSTVLKKDIAGSRVLARKVFRNFGLYLVDFFRIPKLNKENIDRNVKIEGLENIDKALKENKGAIILSCHIGNWEIAGVAVGIKGYDISAVTLNHRHDRINDFFIKQREENGMKVIGMSSVMRGCIRTLLRNGMLALVGDRDFTDSGVTLEFFGVPTSIPKGPAALSLKTGSPIIPGFCIRHDRFSYKLIFEKPIEIKKIPGMTEEEMIKRATESFVPVMEKYIKAYPEQWLVFRRFWEAPTDAFVL
ncbi:MAG: lysophospholipid acyltransferase family protein [Candidatus Gorgyraea atricola]|nr:lysophospholipid acyltransferase family protein [Candidatus Gorgyraea atricola]